MHINKKKKNPLEICIKAFTVVFLAMLFVLSALNFYHGHPAFIKTFTQSETGFSTETIQASEAVFLEYFYKKSSWIDLHGGVQRLMLKHEVGNFNVLKDNDGMLHMPVARLDDETLNRYADNLEAIYKHSQSTDAAFIYLQAPSDFVPGQTDMPAGMEYPANDNLDAFLGILESRQIPCRDTRELYEDFLPGDIFYKTDHHMAMPATFRLFQEAIDIFNTTYQMDLDPQNIYRDINNYEISQYPSSFLGSRGIRTGQYYAGKDLFRVYRPKYETRFDHSYYFHSELQWERQGAFSEVFIDEGILNTPSYNNKYNAFMYGSVCENRIVNNQSDTSLKCLVISDSFSRQLVPYLSQCFYETAWLDPQPGRYISSVLEYIDTFQPDCVVVLINGNSCYIESPL